MRPFPFLSILCLILLSPSCKKEQAPVPNPPDTSGSKLITVIMDEVGGVPIVVAGTRGSNLVVGFESTLDGNQMTFTSVDGSLPIIMEDQEGTQWDIFGNAVNGPGKGAQLKPLNAGMGYWFIFGAMYPGVEIYEGESREVSYTGTTSPGWSIPTNTVFQATGRDAIASIQNPVFDVFNLHSTEEYYLKDNALVIGVSVNGEVRAYPHAILDWHEVVNDIIGDAALAITYCPLTGTGRIWDRKLLGPDPVEFGVSGFLYNSNLIPYDRATGSNWTQLDNKCVNGALINEKINIFPFVETTWGTWKAMFNQPLILSDKIGAGRNYNDYPYGDYRSNHDFLAFPVAVDDDRLKRKERVFGVIVDGKAKVYRLDSF